MFNNNSILVKGKGSEDIHFEKAYDLLFDELVMFGLGYSRSREDIEDAISEVFLRLLKGKQTFESFEKLKSYVFVSVKHKVLNKNQSNSIRENHKEKNKIFVFEDMHSIEDSIIDSEIKREVMEGYNSLPPKCKAIFNLHLEGLSVKQIAEDLDVSENTIKTQKKIALKILREKISSDIFIFFITK